MFAKDPLPAPSLPSSTVKLLRIGQGKISKVTWKSDICSLRVIQDGDANIVQVLLAGSYFADNDWTLVSEAAPIPRQPDNTFEHWHTLESPSSIVEILAISPLGEVERETYVAQISRWPVETVAPPKAFRRKWTLTPNIGVSILSFSETGMSDVNQKALTAKFNVAYTLTPLWDTGVSGYFTLMPISSSPSGTARFLGINLRTGYAIPSIEDPWRVAISAGFYYTSMFVSTDLFGFRNMMGPQLFPSIRRTLKNGNNISGYLKFSPISNNATSISFSSSELALGGAYTIVQRNFHPLSITLDIAKLSLQIETVKMLSTSYSLGVGYGL